MSVAPDSSVLLMLMQILEGSSDGSGIWVPAMHVRTMECVPSLQLWPSPNSAVMAIEE